MVLFALEMVLGSKSQEAPNTDSAASTSPAVYPLAMPLMVTPQGLVAIVTLTAAAHGTSELVLMTGLILGIMAFNFIFLLGAHRILSAIGQAGA